AVGAEQIVDDQLGRSSAVVGCHPEVDVAIALECLLQAGHDPRMPMAHVVGDQLALAVEQPRAVDHVEVVPLLVGNAVPDVLLGALHVVQVVGAVPRLHALPVDLRGERGRVGHLASGRGHEVTAGAVIGTRGAAPGATPATLATSITALGGAFASITTRLKPISSLTRVGESDCTSATPAMYVTPPSTQDSSGGIPQSRVGSS